MKINVWLASTIIAITFLLFPVLQQIAFFTHLTPMYIISVISLLFLYPKFLIKKPFLLIIIYFIVVLFNHWSGDSYFSESSAVWTEIVGLFIGMSFFGYVYDNKNIISIRPLFIAFFIMFSYSSLVTWVLYFQGYSLYDLGLDNPILDSLYSIGMMDYVFPHLVPMLIPAFVSGFRNKNNSTNVRYMFLVLVIFSIMLVVACQAFTPLLVALFSLVLSILVLSGGLRKNIKRIGIVCLILFPFAFSPKIQQDTLRFAKTFVNPEGNYYNKLQDLEYTIYLGSNSAGGALEGRTGLYQDTYHTIANNLLFGTNSSTYGGHSAIPDRFAVLGLVGFIPLLLVVLYQIKLSFKIINEESKAYYLIGVISLICTIMMKNMIRPMTWILMFIYLPLLIKTYGPTNIKYQK
ncbi:MAG: hypothetical protein PHN55_13165 [Dysgonamonadaceae bacterium]|nr:hypothetical protein [Dysgonamonadaceae bacterium]